MKNKIKLELLKPVIIGSTGLLTTLLFGFLLQGKTILIPGNLAFQIFIIAIFSSITYPVILLTKFKISMITYLVCLLMMAIYSFIFREHQDYIGFLLIFSAGLLLFIYGYLIKKEYIIRSILRIVLLTILYPLAILLTLLIDSFFVRLGNPFTIIVIEILLGLIIGLGLGLGFELGAKIYKRINLIQ